MLFTEMEYWTQRATEGLLRLHLPFDSTLALPPRPDAGTVVHATHLFAIHVNRCRMLTVRADEATDMPAILSAAFLANGSNLIHLSLTATTNNLPLHYIRQPSPPICRGSLPELRTLKLSNIVMSWDTMETFTNITCLILDQLTGSLAPGWGQIRRMLLALEDRLERLALRHVRPRPLTYKGNDYTFSLPHVLELDLCICGDIILADLLSTCTFPTLRCLSVAFDDIHDPRLVSRCLFTALPSVTTFYAAGRFFDLASLRNLFTKMLNLEKLDLSDAHPSAFDGFYDRLDGALRPCLRLRELSVLDVHTEALFSLIADRASYASRLSVLNAHYNGPIGCLSMTDNSDLLDWMAPRVDNFRLNPVRVLPFLWSVE